MPCPPVAFRTALSAPLFLYYPDPRYPFVRRTDHQPSALLPPVPFLSGAQLLPTTHQHHQLLKVVQSKSVARTGAACLKHGTRLAGGSGGARHLQAATCILPPSSPTDIIVVHSCICAPRPHARGLDGTGSPHPTPSAQHAGRGRQRDICQAPAGARILHDPPFVSVAAALELLWRPGSGTER